MCLVFNADRIPVTGEVSLQVAQVCFMMDKSSYFFIKGLCVILKSSIKEIPFGSWFYTEKFGTCLNGSFVLNYCVLHNSFIFNPKELKTAMLLLKVK